jgi:hypothetical protein
MLIKEYYDDDGQIEFAKVLFRIDGKEMRSINKALREDYQRAMQKVQEQMYPIHKARLDRQIDNLASAIWKHCLSKSLAPKYTKQDAMQLAIAIFWNDADLTKEVLSYTDEFGERVFPRE